MSGSIGRSLGRIALIAVGGLVGGSVGAALGDCAGELLLTDQVPEPGDDLLSEVPDDGR